jgi:predicted MPP superfamily phosphohydrolase
MMLSLGATAISIPQKRRFRVRHLAVDVPGLPAKLEGMTIAHLSDTHVGKFTRGEVLDRIVTDSINFLIHVLSALDFPQIREYRSRFDPHNTVRKDA